MAEVKKNTSNWAEYLTKGRLGLKQKFGRPRVGSTDNIKRLCRTRTIELVEKLKGLMRIGEGGIHPTVDRKP